MTYKFLEMKARLSIQCAREILWGVHEAHIKDTLTEKLNSQKN